MLVKAANLKRLLECTSRKQFVNQKPQQQVIGCVIRSTSVSEENDSATTVSLVRDGKTSIAKFSIPSSWLSKEEPLVIPDIDRLIGVLSAHGGEVTLSQDGGSLRIKSKGKQTTLVAEPGSLAFPHSQETIAQWEDKSVILSSQIDAHEGTYKMRDGSLREAFFHAETSSQLLHEAMKCDNLNAQKLNRYTFVYDGQSTLTLLTGFDLKGETETILNDDCAQHEGKEESWESTYEGGLEQVLSNYDGMVTLHFLDFRPEGQGIRLIIQFDNEDWVFQAAIIKR